MKTELKIITITFLAMLSSYVYAEDLYVTDRILLGIHQSANEQSPILKSIASGTKVKVLAKQGKFIKIKSADGTEGWVAASFLVKNKPATKEYDNLFKLFQEKVETLKVVNERLTKKEREIQIKRDQLSNATTSIKELKNKLKNNTATVSSEVKVIDSDGLEKAQQEVKRLKTKLLALEQKVKDSKVINPNDTQSRLIKAQQENTLMRNSIEMAMASLEGKHVPTAEELAGIRASFPAWYWGLTLVMIILGVIGGVVWHDYRNRKRHGGFRI